MQEIIFKKRFNLNLEGPHRFAPEASKSYSCYEKPISTHVDKSSENKKSSAKRTRTNFYLPSSFLICLVLVPEKAKGVHITMQPTKKDEKQTKREKDQKFTHIRGWGRSTKPMFLNGEMYYKC